MKNASKNQSLPNWRDAVLLEGSTIEQAIKCLNDTGIQIVLVVGANGGLVGTVTDGDIRRGLLRGLNLKGSLESVTLRNPLVVPPDLKSDLVAQLMRANRIHQLPVVDEQGSVVGLHLWDEISTPKARSSPMVIMAGGLGTRLQPHTETCPKPLLPVAGKPMLEHIVERARNEGFVKFFIAIRYLGHLIEEYFGDGSRWNVDIQYLREADPLGTAGALSMLDPRPTESIVVTNGDVLTDVRYGEFLEFHLRNGAAATMAVRLFEWQHPYGVVATQGIDITGFEEKPVYRSNVNAGVYALRPEALDSLLPAQRCDMPMLFQAVQSKGQRIVVYPMHEPWLDVGRPGDYAQASAELEKQK
jgi:dTDP-glucose pyrophosphorylase